MEASERKNGESKTTYIYFFVKINSIRQVENMRMNLRQYQKHNEV